MLYTVGSVIPLHPESMTEKQAKAWLQKMRTRAARAERKALRLLLGGLTVLLILAGFRLALRGGAGEKSLVFASEIPRAPGARIFVADAGQGLGILIESRGEAMLIDGGCAETAPLLLRQCKAWDVGTLKYLVLTHYDADHLAAALTVFRTIGAETVLGPDYTADTALFGQLRDALAESGKEMYFPPPGAVFPLGGASFEILGPLRRYEKENDNCLVLRFSDGKHSLLTGGDAEEEAETELARHWGARLKSDLYVADHHGSAGSSIPAFLRQLRPAAVIVSCGRDNAFGHPHGAFLARIRRSGALLLRTDEQGSLTFGFTDENIILYNSGEEQYAETGHEQGKTFSAGGLERAESRSRRRGEVFKGQDRRRKRFSGLDRSAGDL